jgi:tetratricopeptide (TPR) repeat protein
MKLRHRILLILCFAALPLFAQTNPADTLNKEVLNKADLNKMDRTKAELKKAVVLYQQGQIDKAIAGARSLTDSGEAAAFDLGRAYILLGTAYNQKGQLYESQHALESAIRIFEHDPDHISEYASALSNYGALYCDLGQLDTAEAIWLKSLHLRQQIGDHAASMRSLTTLAGLELGKNRMHPAREYLKQAAVEVKSDRQSRQNDLIEDDFALLFETQAWLAMKEGHPGMAITFYQHSLDISRRARGDEHWLTGWEHLLLGKAYAQAGNLDRATFEMRDGLRIMEPVLGRTSPNFLVGELAYAQLLDRTGSHADAAEIRSEAEQARKDLLRTQCAGCTINVEGFR